MRYPDSHNGWADEGGPVTMIVTRLMCGLGNQMFQYAAGRSLALRLGT